MRFQGRIISWDDARGFGFVQWNGAQDRLFVHVGACPRHRRPKVGDIVSYEVATTAGGRNEAKRLAFADEAHRRPAARPVSEAAASGIGLGPILVAVASVAIGFGAWRWWEQRPAPGAMTPSAARTGERLQPPIPNRFGCEAGKTRCSQMSSCEEATFYLRHCPGTEMDGDGDGVPCESQWCDG